jgi:hypothetical protein
MPRAKRDLGGRPELRRLPPRASEIIWQAVWRALREHGKPSACLAGTSGGVTRSDRTIRQDLANKSELKVLAAWFLVRRLSEERLIERGEFLRLEAVLNLCDAQPVEHNVDQFGRVVPAGLFLSPYLSGELVTAIAAAWPPLRERAREAITDAVERVLGEATIRAHREGAVEAYAGYLAERQSHMSDAEKRKRIRAFKWARQQLGVTSSQSLLGEELDLLTDDR